MANFVYIFVLQCAEAEPEPVPEVLSFKKPHRRRRGARKSERKNKSSQLLATTQVSNEDSSAGPTISGELEAAKAPVKSEVKTSHRHLGSLKKAFAFVLLGLVLTIPATAAQKSFKCMVIMLILIAKNCANVFINAI